MDRKVLVNEIIRDFFIIYFGTMMATVVFCSIFVPSAIFHSSYFLWTIVIAVFGDLPILVFYSENELSERQWMIRYLIHFILVECVVLIIGRILGLYRSVQAGAVFAVLILAVYFLTKTIAIFLDNITANMMNQKIEQNRKNK